MLPDKAISSTPRSLSLNRRSRRLSPRSQRSRHAACIIMNRNKQRRWVDTQRVSQTINCIEIRVLKACLQAAQPCPTHRSVGSQIIQGQPRADA